MHICRVCFFAIILLTVLLTSCSNLNKLNPEEKKSQSYQKLTKTIGLIENHYVEKIELYTLINSTAYGLSAEIKKENYNVKLKYAHSSYTKDELYKTLEKNIETVKNNTSYSYDEIVIFAIKELVDNLDKYSVYINNKLSQGSIKKKPILSKTVDNKYLYIKIYAFDKNTTESIKKIIQTADKTTTKGIVLDLRDNLGGLFDPSISSIDLFVDKGIVLSKRGRDIHNVTTYKALSDTTITKLPLVILVNENSASSSEIVSGSLKDLGRATVVGEKTFGKGSIQVLIPITKDKSEYIKLTVAKYYLPNGRLIDNKIIPDIVVTNSTSNHDEQLSSAIEVFTNPAYK